MLDPPLTRAAPNLAFIALKGVHLLPDSLWTIRTRVVFDGDVTTWRSPNSIRLPGCEISRSPSAPLVSVYPEQPAHFGDACEMAGYVSRSLCLFALEGEEANLAVGHAVMGRGKEGAEDVYVAWEVHEQVTVMPQQLSLAQDFVGLEVEDKIVSRQAGHRKGW